MLLFLAMLLVIFIGNAFICIKKHWHPY